jgi:hypothetical protein
MTPPATGMDQISTDAAFNRVKALVNRLFAIVFVALLVAVAAGLWLRYSEVIRDGRRSAENLANVLSEYLVVRLGAIDGLLSRVVANSRKIGGPEGSDKEWMSALRSATTGVPGISSVVILDADGTVVHATIPQIGGLSWADRPIFKELAAGHANLLAVDLPMSMIAGDQVLVPLGRSLTDPRGDFVGAAVATLIPAQLQDFYRTFDLGRDGVTWVLLPTGQVLFRQGAAEDDNVPPRDPPQFLSEHPMSEDGFVAAPIESGGPSYLTAYRKAEIGNVVAVVSLSEHDLLAGFWYGVAAGAVFVVVSAFFLFFAARKINSAVLSAIETAEADDDRAAAL